MVQLVVRHARDRAVRICRLNQIANAVVGIRCGTALHIYVGSRTPCGVIERAAGPAQRINGGDQSVLRVVLILSRDKCAGHAIHGRGRCLRSSISVGIVLIRSSRDRSATAADPLLGHVLHLARAIRSRLSTPLIIGIRSRHWIWHARGLLGRTGHQSGRQYGTAIRRDGLGIDDLRLSAGWILGQRKIAVTVVNIGRAISIGICGQGRLAERI